MSAFVEVPKDEERLRSLYALQLLDTPRQDTFDRVVQLASKLCNCTISLVTLVDKDRQWFLARLGIRENETPRSQSFCNHALAKEALLDVPDTRTDKRFCDNPLVKAGPKIRSYMGQPIQSPDGALIGAMCVADQEPWKFDSQTRKNLAVLADVVNDLISAHAEFAFSAKLSENLAEKNTQLTKINNVFLQAEKASKMGSWEIDFERDTLIWSDGVYKIHDMDPSQPVQLDEGISFYVSKDRSRIEKIVRDAIQLGQAFQFEGEIRTASGTIKRLSSQCEFLSGEGINGGRLVGVVRDVTEEHHNKVALKKAAEYDSLTGLYNRYAFDRLLGERLKSQRHYQTGIGILLIDLDGFKAINDTFGHLAGDAVLEEISVCIANIIPEGSIVARWGGDEFVVVPQEGSGKAEIEALGKNVLSALRKTFMIFGQKLAVSGTCGLVYSEEFLGGRELVRRADLALYYGKRRGKGDAHFYDGHMEKVSHRSQVAIVEVRDAIEGGRVYPGYQPIVELDSKKVVGFEALLRLHNRKGKNLTAQDVMPAILDPVLSRDIGQTMLDLVASDINQIAHNHQHLRHVSLNATEADLISRGFAGQLLATLENKNVDPQRLTLEVAETVLMVNDADTIKAVLERLSAAGVRIALDDFGTGFSSLSHLRDFPIDIVKIDKSFVDTLASDDQCRLIVQALIAMAQHLKIKVIAEGIETEEQRDILLQMGCCYGQGFLFGAAQAREEMFVKKITRRSLPALG